MLVLNENNEVALRNEIQEIISIDIVVDDKPSFEYASEFILQIDSKIKKVKEFFKPEKDKAFQAHKEICQRETEILSLADITRKKINKQISEYLTALEKKRIEDQRKADELLRKQMEEKERKEEELRKKAEAGKISEAKLNKELDKLDPVMPIIVEKEVEKTERMANGTVSQTKDIEIEVIDMKAFLKAVIDKTDNLDFIDIKSTKLKNFIKVQGIKEFAGLKIEEKVKASFRGRG